MEDNKLEKYIKRIYEIKEQENKNITTDYLKEIASDMGMSEDDWEVINNTFVACLQRGQGFVKHNNYDDAILELKKAEEINPNHIEVLSSLMQAYLGRYELQKNINDASKAQNYAYQCLQVQPNHEVALSIISTLKLKLKSIKKNNAASGKTKKYAFFGLAVIITILSAFLIWKFSSPKQDLYATQKEGKNARILDDNKFYLVRTNSGNGLFIRESPHKEAKKTILMPDNSKVAVLKQGTEWSKIDFGGNVGWTYTQYLIEESKANTALKYERAIVKTVSGQGLIMRSAASTQASQITSLPEEAKVAILKKSYEWYYVEYGKYKGWVASRYLRLVE